MPQRSEKEGGIALQASLSEYYNRDYSTYADYYLDFLAVSCTLLNVTLYHEQKIISKEKQLLLFQLAKNLSASMSAAAQLLERLDTDLKEESELLKKIASEDRLRG